MKQMDHAEVDELLAAYALDALPIEEARRIEAHLQQCPEHRQAAAQLRATASRMALAVDDQQPPPHLRQRIAESVRGVPQGESSGEPAAGAPVLPLQAPASRRWRGRFPRPAQLAAAAAVLIALGIGIIAGTRIAQPAQQSWNFSGNQLAPRAEATLLYDRSRKTAVVAATGLPSLRPGQVYEVWLIRQGSPVDAGIATGPDGKLVIRLDRDVTQYDTLAITVEPGEQAVPTTSPIVAGKLS